MCTESELAVLFGFADFNQSRSGPGAVGQAHVHIFGQWKLANRSVMINRN